MSHFLTLVIVEEKRIRTRSDAEGEVARLLAPYDEALVTAPRPVYMDAADVHDMAKHYGMPLTDLVALAKKIEDWHSLPGGITEEGDLYYLTTHNEQGKWDWYCIGGRWTGWATKSDPAADPENYEPCWVCGATGLRNDAPGTQARQADPDYTCNGCRGSRQMLRFPSKWKRVESDISPVASLRSDSSPHAIITPDGEWHEAGRMVSFAIVLDEKPDVIWDDEVASLLTKYQNGYLAVVVDCHT